MAAVLKTAWGSDVSRGFESHALRNLRRRPDNLRLVGAPSGRGQRFDDHGRDALRYLVGKKENVSRDRHDTNMRTLLEHCPFILCQAAIAFLCVHDPCRYAGFAEAPRGIIVSM